MTTAWSNTPPKRGSAYPHASVMRATLGHNAGIALTSALWNCGACRLRFFPRIYLR
jgi:hypothetical protein